MGHVVRDIGTLHGKFHEAVANPDLWPETLGSIAATFSSRGCLLTTPHFGHGGVPHSPGMKDVLEQFFCEGWHLRDLRTNLARAKPQMKGFFADHDLISSTDMSRHEYYREFAAKAGVPWFAAAVLTSRPGGDFVALSLQRSRSEGPFSKRELRDLNALLPQLQDAAELAQRLSTLQGKSLVDGLELASEAAILLDAGGKVAYFNRLAAPLLGSAISIASAKVSASRPDDNVQLLRLIDKACAALTSRDAISVLAPVSLRTFDGEQRIVARAAPIRRSGADVLGFSGVVLMLTDVYSCRRYDVSAATTLFGLTPREANVLGALGQHRTLEALGDHLGISREAVRFHLKSIFVKTGTHRQAELVELLGKLRLMAGP